MVKAVTPGGTTCGSKPSSVRVVRLGLGEPGQSRRERGGLGPGLELVVGHVVTLRG